MQVYRLSLLSKIQQTTLRYCSSAQGGGAALNRREFRQSQTP